MSKDEKFIHSLLTNKISIDVGLPLDNLVDAAERVIATQPNIYQKSGELVSVIHNQEKHTIKSLKLSLARYYLSRAAYWINASPDDLKHDEYVHPPSSITQCLLDQGEWEHIRPLRAVITFPPIDNQGNINSTPGYDETTSVFFAGGVECSIPDNPTIQDSQKAIATLYDIVSDFPFASHAHRAVWLAALLTPLTRFAHDGNAPLTVVQANCPRVGKTTLVQIISEIVMGTECPVIVASQSEDEERKRILSYLRIARSIVLIDNITGIWGGESINAMATARAFEDRVLGSTKIISAQNDTTWFITGNNIQLAPDTAQRSLHIKLLSNEEHPQLRKGFHYSNIISVVKERRAELLSAALTIIKAYQKSPMNMQLDAWGSFESWSRLVRGALVWAGEPDPASTRAELEESDPERGEAHALVEGWLELQKALQKDSVSAREAYLALIKEWALAPRLRESLGAFTPNRLPPPHTIGRHLREVKDRVLGGLVMRCIPDDKKGHRWYVESV